VRDVIHLAGDQVIKTNDLMPFLDQAITQVGAQETGTASDQGTTQGS